MVRKKIIIREFEAFTFRVATSISNHKEQSLKKTETFIISNSPDAVASGLNPPGTSWPPYGRSRWSVASSPGNT